MESFDVIIVGGGASGIMAALSVKRHHPGKTVAILEKTFELGRKLLVSGAGRCNITNRNYQDNPGKFFHGNSQFITSVIGQFGYDDIIRFFSNLGIPTYEEKKTGLGKIFPLIDHAKTVRDILIDALKEQQVQIVCETTVKNIMSDGTSWRVETNKGMYQGASVILTAGGQTYPALGSDGSGYTLAASCGHTIVTPVVAAVPLVSKNALCHYLQGEKSMLRVDLRIDGNTVSSTVGEVLFTQYGFSGPAMLDISHDASIRINRQHLQGIRLSLSFLPYATPDEAETIVRERLVKHGNLPVAHSLWGLMTEKIAGALCAVSGLPKELLGKDINEKQRSQLLQNMTGYTAEISGTRGWNEAEFTAGGIKTDEINQKTLESKLCNGLYFAGEIMDVDGAVGGFNLSWAWSSGWVAGCLQ